MSHAVIIKKKASELRVGDRLMETDGGGLWHHVATVLARATYDETLRAWTVSLQTPREAGDVVFTGGFREHQAIDVETIV